MSASSLSGDYCLTNTKSVMEEKLIDLTLTSSAVKELIDLIEDRMSTFSSYSMNKSTEKKHIERKTLRDYLVSKLSE